MRKLTAILVASSLALGAAGVAYANDAPTKGQGHETRMTKGERGPRAAMHEDWMFKDLNLTDAQKKQVADIIRAARDNMRQSMQAEHQSLQSIIAADTFDQAKAQDLVNKQDDLHKTRMMSRLETQNKIYNILTAEQKKQFSANFEKRLSHRMSGSGDKAAAE